MARGLGIALRALGPWWRQGALVRGALASTYVFIVSSWPRKGELDTGCDPHGRPSRKPFTIHVPSLLLNHPQREAKEKIKRMAEQVREENARKQQQAAAAALLANRPPRQRASPSARAAGTQDGGSGGEDGPGGQGQGQGNGDVAAAAAGQLAGGRGGKDKEPSARERALQFAKNIPKPEVKKKAVVEGAGAGGGGGEEEGRQLSELELLERQHAERQQEVDRIRAELARVL